MTTGRATTPVPRNSFMLNQTPFALQTGEALLQNKQIQRLLGQIQKLANVPAEHYPLLYASTLEAYAAYVQELPASQVSGYTFNRGLLELGIERSLRALVLYRKEIPLKGTTPEDMDPKWALYTYALFTAGLFYGLGQLTATYIVYLCDKRGNDSERWLPVSGPMTNLPYTHYRYALDSERRDALAARATPLVARVLMPEQGFNWLASDTDIFGYWLAILQNDEKHGELLSRFILPAQKDLMQSAALIAQTAAGVNTLDSIEKDMAEFLQSMENSVADKASGLTKQELINARLASFAGLTPGSDITERQLINQLNDGKLAALLTNWLRVNALKNTNLRINSANAELIVNERALFIRGDVIQQFMRDMKITANINVVAKTLQQQGIVLARQTAKGATATYFIMQDVTRVFNGEQLPVMHESINVPSANKLNHTYPDTATHTGGRRPSPVNMPPLSKS